MSKRRAAMMSVAVFILYVLLSIFNGADSSPIATVTLRPTATPICDPSPCPTPTPHRVYMPIVRRDRTQTPTPTHNPMTPTLRPTATPIPNSPTAAPVGTGMIPPIQQTWMASSPTP